MFFYRESISALLSDFLTNNTSFRALSIDYEADLSSFPYFQCIQSLRLQRWFYLTSLDSRYCQSLQKLELLFCRSIVDVAPFDSISTLLLYCCSGISDVSVLNHNRKVSVVFCSNITDYTNCFRYSQEITIIESDYPAAPIKIDVSSFTHCRTFTLNLQTVGLSSSEPQRLSSLPPAAKRCSFINCNLSPLLLSSLQFVRIENYFPSDASLEGLAEVPVVELIGLWELASLEGLGRKNRFVYLECCSKITNFEPLCSVPKVKIINCRGFQRPEQLQGIRELVLSSDDSNLDLSALNYRLSALELIDCTNVSVLQQLKGISTITLVMSSYAITPVIRPVLGNQRLVLLNWDEFDDREVRQEYHITRYSRNQFVLVRKQPTEIETSQY